MSHRCPRCAALLTPETRAQGRVKACATCGGVDVALEELARRLAPAAADALWNGARETPEGAPLPCPQCAQPMKVTRVPGWTGAVLVDLCPRCRLAWFDRGELEPLAAARPEPGIERARIEAAVAFERFRREESRDAGLAEVHPWSTPGVAGALGLPTVEGAERRHQAGWATWTVAGGIVAAQLLLVLHVGLGTWLSGPLATNDYGRLLSAWGFVPADPLRHGGLNLLVAPFLHVGALHMVVNAWFLVLASQPLEARHGPWRLLTAFAVGVLGGHLGDALLRWGQTMPCVGASGGVAGVFAACALALPTVTLGFTFRTFHRQAEPRLIQLRLGVRWVFGVWLLLQAFAAFGGARTGLAQTVSYGAHLGGALAGAASWWSWLRPRSRD